ncbi:MAG: bifunctional diaminohydroxyphosphoribosylaminopyrimidine deaminase/5-amino-6-(5-phosphoribosylamino)uracil reductase RibD [Desulfobacterales bacterium]
MDDEFFMKIALDLARRGLGYTSPNPVVGALVVKNDMVVGKGYHAGPGQAHAEVNAIDNAGASATNATLYVTLEPCNHTGRTPPCTERILSAGITRVVVAMRDPNPDVTGGGLEYLHQKGVKVRVGVCEEQAKTLNEAFIKHIQTKRPFVTLKCAATLDGMIATKTGDSKWVSGEGSRAFVHQLRQAADAILVGVNTIRKDNSSLTTRIRGQKGSDPRRIILDTHLSIPEKAQVLQLESDSDTVIAIGPFVPKKKKVAFEKIGIKFIEAPVKNGLIDLDFLMNRLGQSGITSLLVEGGGRVIASFLRADIVDKIIFFYAPKLLGGNDGIPICRGSGAELMQDCISVKDLKVSRFGDDVMIEGYIDNSFKF